MDEIEPDEAYWNALGEHLVRHIGPVTNVFREVRSDAVHVDVLVIGPRDERPYHTLVTCGMSERPMRVPIESPDDVGKVPELRFAELLLCLPPDWPLSPSDFKDEANYWPVRWLKMLARLPHQHDGWLGLGHSVPNGDPPRPLGPGVGFAGWFIDEPVLFPAEVRKFRFGDRATNLYAAVPVYEEEMTLKVRKGRDALTTLFNRAKTTELIDVSRPNLV